MALVFGASSAPGTHLLRQPPAGWALEAAGRTDPRTWGLPLRRFHPLDLSDGPAVRALLSGSPADAWINLAIPCLAPGPADARGMGALGAGDPERERSLLVDLPGWLADEAERQDRYLVQLSTDEVFDGEAGPYGEEDPPSPPSDRLSPTGAALGTGEARVYASRARRAIVRVCRPYGGGHPSRPDWVAQWAEALERGAPLVIPSAEQITPTWVPDLTEALGAILDRQPRRIYHVASPEVVSLDGFLAHLCREAGLPARRGGVPEPGNGRRGGLRVREVHKLGVRPLGYREGLRRFVGDRGSQRLSSGSPNRDNSRS